MSAKFMMRLCICTIAIIVFIFFEAFEKIDVDKRIDDLKGYIATGITIENIGDTLVILLDRLSDLGVIDYGEPIDKNYKGSRVPVYAVSGGQVSAVGENEEIGRYIVIVHGNQTESLYGNLEEIKVDVPANVRKGQIIGIYDNTKDNDFYYSLKEIR